MGRMEVRAVHSVCMVALAAAHSSLLVSGWGNRLPTHLTIPTMPGKLPPLLNSLMESGQEE